MLNETESVGLSVLKGEGFPVPVKKEKLKYRINTKFFGGNDELSEFYEGNTTGSYEFSIKKEYSAPANEVRLHTIESELTQIQNPDILESSSQ